MLAEMTQWLVDMVSGLGYAGIVLFMAIESTVIPVPSEVIMIPAGYLVAQGKMEMTLVILSGTVGSVLGALINYFGALWIGRPVLERYGRYFFVKPQNLQKMDLFFVRHGAISTFIGRLVPGARHLISIPAGLSRMNLTVFGFYTALGAGIWCAVLAFLGYYIGGNEALIKEYVHEIVTALLAGAAIVIAVYLWFLKKEAESDRKDF